MDPEPIPKSWLADVQQIGKDWRLALFQDITAIPDEQVMWYIFSSSCIVISMIYYLIRYYYFNINPLAVPGWLSSIYSATKEIIIALKKYYKERNLRSRHGHSRSHKRK